MDMDSEKLKRERTGDLNWTESWDVNVRHCTIKCGWKWYWRQCHFHDTWDQWDRPTRGNEEFMQILQCHCVISSTSGQHKLLMIIIYRMQRWLRLLCITITDGAAGDECLCLQSAITLVNYKFVESCYKEWFLVDCKECVCISWGKWKCVAVTEV